MRFFLLPLLIFIVVAHQSYGQRDSAWQKAPTLAIEGFVDVFYAYDFNEPSDNARQSFFFNHNRHHEFNLNLALVKLGLSHQKYRANIALQVGTYPIDNYAAEAPLLRFVNEANLGISLNKKNNLWLDAGIFPSHIGFETALSNLNPTLTRSLLAENSPYFLTGAKLGYQPTEKWEFTAVICNGWQRIQRLPGNSLPSFGTQVNYKPNEVLTLNWSTLLGSEYPDSTRRMRYFNNFYAQFTLFKKLNLTTGFDIGLQQSSKNSSTYDNWFTPILIAQYVFNKHWQIALRAEYYHDPTRIMISTNSASAFRSKAFSWNIDYCPRPEISCRLEARWLNSRDKIFELADNTFSNNNFFLVASMALQLRKDW